MCEGRAINASMVLLVREVVVRCKRNSVVVCSWKKEKGREEVGRGRCSRAQKIDNRSGDGHFSPIVAGRVESEVNEACGSPSLIGGKGPSF